MRVFAQPLSALIPSTLSLAVGEIRSPQPDGGNFDLHRPRRYVRGTSQPTLLISAVGLLNEHQLSCNTILIIRMIIHHQ